MRALDIASTGMLAQQLNVEVIANNLANVNTTGFKRSHAEFQDLLYQNLRRVGTETSDAGTTVPTGIQLGLGVKTAAVYRIHEQGNLQQTSNSLDLAMSGLGFFEIQMPDGTLGYSRAGSFQLSKNGEVVTQDGYLVNPGLTIPQNATSIAVSATGVVSATVAGQTTPQFVGQITVSTFINESGLQAIGNNLYKETEASGTPQTGLPGSEDRGIVSQGFLENSNVNTVSEITNLISAQRAYEMNSRVIETTNQMLGTLSALR
ncbi:MAG: flagellar basal-body rod protein FlgG [Alphaproteobacteria bacterium]|nr:flagellar basal-body rod protein FlgG [Alphaproteobacteria bacterium]